MPRNVPRNRFSTRDFFFTRFYPPFFFTIKMSLCEKQNLQLENRLNIACMTMVSCMYTLLVLGPYRDDNGIYCACVRSTSWTRVKVCSRSFNMGGLTDLNTRINFSMLSNALRAKHVALHMC